MQKNKIRVLAAVAALLGIGAYAYWSKVASAPVAVAKAPVTVPVTVAQAELGSVPVLLEMVGRAEAYEGVTLKSRIDGQVASAVYTEGQHVRQGDVLVRLDPADFTAKALQAEANVARDEALLAKAKADVVRYLALKERGFVSEEKVNEVRTAEAAAAATTRADKAALDLARLQLSYTTLRAPFSGVVGARLVFPGSAVKVNDTALAVVNRISPLYVTFSVPEKHLPRLRAAMGKGALSVLASVPGSKSDPVKGEARFIDNAVDAASGTIQMKAVLANRDERLTPGQFLNVSMTLDKLEGAVLIPSEAVQQGAEGNFLYVVKPEGVVEPRKIEVLTTFRGRSAIAQGLAAGETVVLDGQLRLAPGSTVKIKSDEAPAAPVISAPAAAPAAR